MSSCYSSPIFRSRLVLMMSIRFRSLLIFVLSWLTLTAFPMSFLQKVSMTKRPVYKIYNHKHLKSKFNGKKHLPICISSVSYTYALMWGTFIHFNLLFIHSLIHFLYISNPIQFFLYINFLDKAKSKKCRMFISYWWPCQRCLDSI